MTKSLIRLDSIVRASLDSNCMTNRHDERQWDDNDDAMTETDSDITRDYDSITRSYRREREGVEAIGLDWLGRVLLIGWRGGWGMAAGLVPLACPSRPLSQHPSSSLSLSSPPSTSI